MNKIFFALAALAACSPAFAQEDSSFWRVYDTKTKKEQNVEVKHFRSMSIVGEDDRQEITGRAQKFEKAAVVLELEASDGTKVVCSGAMIGKNIVLTAAHCLTTENNHFYQTVQVTAAGLQGDKDKSTRQKDFTKLIKEGLKGSKVNKTPTISEDLIFPSAKAVKLWVPLNWKNISSKYDEYKSYDYGIIILDSNLGDTTGWFKITSKKTAELQQKEIIVLGRGYDKPLNTLWRSEGRIGSLSSHFIYHNADMVGGNSGGPILLKDDPYTIIAINNFDQGDEYLPEGEYVNGGLRISDDIIISVNKIQTRK